MERTDYRTVETPMTRTVAYSAIAAAVYYAGTLAVAAKVTAPTHRPPTPSLSHELAELDRAQRVLDEHTILMSWLSGFQTPAPHPKAHKKGKR